MRVLSRVVFCVSVSKLSFVPTIGDYWGWYNKRWYHHTGMVSTWYAMREAYAVMAEEGLPAMWARHHAVHEQLWEGLTDLGLEPFVEKEDDRLVTVNAIKVGVGYVVACVMHV